MPITVPATWVAPLARLAAVWLGLIVLFFADWRAMVGQWWNSSTYNHILLIPLVLAWLVSQRRHELARLVPSLWWPPLVLFAGAGLLWLLGQFAGLALARQLAVVVMAQAAFAVVMGPRVVAALLFPLGYMLFLVPIGDELIPFLQTLTARITMVLLGLAQVPAHIEGVFITTPAGYFEVAEACSGVKFLIAMLAYGTLVANVCFLRASRRAGFIALSVLVPIVANGLRAFGTIWIAGWYGIRFASGFDHVFYGWVFFALVMAACMAVGWRWFDRPVDAAMIDADALVASPLLSRLAARRLGAIPALGVLAALALLFTGWAALAGSLEAKLPGGIHLPAIAGWEPVATDDGVAWSPLHGGSDQQFHMRFRDAGGHVVDVSYALYASQREGHQAGGFGQGAVPMGSRWAWERTGVALGHARAEVIQAPGTDQRTEHRLCQTWYRHGALLSGSNLALRLQVMADHLLLRRQLTSVLILSASDRLNGDPAAALAAFVKAAGPVDRWIDHLSSGRA